MTAAATLQQLPGKTEAAWRCRPAGVAFFSALLNAIFRYSGRGDYAKILSAICAIKPMRRPSCLFAIGGRPSRSPLSVSSFLHPALKNLFVG